MADDSTFDKVTGKAKEFAGKVTGNKDTEAEGKAQHAEGKVKEFAEDVKSDVKAVGDKIKGAFKKD